MPGVPLLLKLVVAHLLGDFVLQSDRDAREKHRLPVLLRHVAVHGGALAIVAWTEAPVPARLWLAFLGVVVSHALIDRATSRMNARPGWRLLIDQLLHLVVILIAVSAVRQSELGAMSIEASRLAASAQVWLQVAGFLATVWLGAVVVGLWVRPFAQAIEARLALGRPGLERAGRWIGCLERAIVFLAVQFGFESLIGFVVAAKALLRLPEARDRGSRELSEYYLVGSLASLLWAVVASLITRWLVRHVTTGS